MIYPAVDGLIDKMDDKYTLVIAVAKRARQLCGESAPLVKTTSTNDITIALEEINNDKIVCERLRDNCIKRS